MEEMNSIISNNNSNNNNVMNNVEEFWKDDFLPLEDAGKAVLIALREDEAAPDADLYRRITASDAGSHRYFLSATALNAITTNTSTTTNTTTTTTTATSTTTRNNRGFQQAHQQSISMEHAKSVPLPTFLSQQLQSVKSHTFMGLFPEAQLAWLSVDDKLFLWPFSNNASATTDAKINSTPMFCSFTVPNGQCVLSVGLAPPKKGVFNSLVQWCLVVTTHEEIILCALAVTDTNNSSTKTSNNSMSPGQQHHHHQQSMVGFRYGQGRILSLIPTSYTVSTDYIRVLCISSTTDGRIFMGGEDGCLYEMMYGEETISSTTATSVATKNQNALDDRLQSFYDQGQVIPAVLQDETKTALSKQLIQGSKRVLSTVVFGTNGHSSPYQRPRKCRKLNHSPHVPALAKALLPDFILKATSYIIGTGQGAAGGKIIKMVVDEERSCLYTLTSKGWICSFSIENDDTSALGTLSGTSSSSDGHQRSKTEQQQTIKLAAVMDVPKTARLYLEAVGRGQMLSPSSYYSSSAIGKIVFPGGGVPAQAGVGGMEGARSILKLADFATNKARNNTFGNNNSNSKNSNNNNILMPISLHIIPRKESSRLTLLVVTKGGLRYYLSSLSDSIISTGRPSSYHFGMNRNQLRNPLGPSHKLTLCHIRAPPPPFTVGTDQAGNTGGSSSDFQQIIDSKNTVVGGFIPSVSASLNKVSQVSAAFYNQGIFALATEIRGGREGALCLEGNKMMAVAPDSVLRKEETLDGDASASAQTHVVVGPNELSSAVKIAPGGISETISFPMSVAYGSTDVVPGGMVWDIASTTPSDNIVLNLMLNSKTPTDSELSVGLVPAYFPRSKVPSRDINANGNTSRYLTPPLTTNGTPVANDTRETAVAKNITTSMTMNIMMNIIPAIFFSRPLIPGVHFQRPSLDDGTGTGSNTGNGSFPQNSYRISTLYGCRGYSLTAADVVSTSSRSQSSNKTNKAGMTSKSARLSRWLLRPSIVPLNPLTIQHLLTSNQVVTINAGGLQYFESVTILARLAEALIAAGANVEKDKCVTSFFTSYGYVEGCAMCLFLAIGCGQASYNDALPPLASRAALARAYKPKLVPINMNSATVGSGTAGRTTTTATTTASVAGAGNNLVLNDSTDVDPFIPVGYEFQPSALSRGLTSVISRLVRPIWYKPAVVVTEGRTILRQRWRGLSPTDSSYCTTTSAKVELLLDDITLEHVRKPLSALQILMKDMFSRAVNTVPGVRRRNNNSMMDIDGIPNEEATATQDHYITRALSYHSHQRRVNGTNLISGQLASSEAEMIAHVTEERKIHSLYRLISRTVQLLSLLSILKRVHYMQELPEVDWGLLHGLTISQLVQARDGQDRLESLLNSLVTSSSLSLSSSSQSLSLTNYVAPSAEADQLANQFAEHCYLYFSPGARFAYLGFRHANQSLSYTPGSMKRADFTRQALDCFRQAAKHWHSAPLITGRLLHMKEKEKYETIALRAKKFGSPLAKASSALIQLGEVAGVVDICLMTASNFGAKFDYKEPLPESSYSLSSCSRMFAWEQDLYHKRKDPLLYDDSNGRSSSTHQSSTSPSSSSAIRGGIRNSVRSTSPASTSNTNTTSASIALGTAVTTNDAIETCYSLVFYHLSILLQTNSEEATQAAKRMVSACAAVTDTTFSNKFLQHLYDNEHTDTLLCIRSTAVEKWLRDHEQQQLQQQQQNYEKRTTHLLYRYFVVQRQHSRAGQVSWERAKNPNFDFSLEERIECLSRALNSFKAALKETLTTTSTGNWTQLGSGINNDVTSYTHRELEQLNKEVEETLDVARLQSRILRRAFDSGLSSTTSDNEDNDQEKKDVDYNRLSYSLLPISDLYNDYAAKLHMFDLCLLIFHACKTHDDAVPKLWHAIMCEVILPCTTYSTKIYTYINNYSKDCLVNDKITLLNSGSTTLNDAGEQPPVFENGDWWLKQIEQKIITLGREVYNGTGADHVFPINFILSNLEGLYRTLLEFEISSESATTGLASPRRDVSVYDRIWPLRILISVGVPYITTLEAYEVIIKKNDQESMMMGGDAVGSASSGRRINNLATIVDFLRHWVSAARSARAGERSMEPYQELTQAVSSRLLTTKVESYRNRLEVLPQVGIVAATLGNLDDVQHAIKLIVF